MHPFGKHINPRLMAFVEEEIFRRETFKLKCAAGIGAVGGCMFGFMTIGEEEAKSIIQHTTKPGYVLSSIALGATIGGFSGIFLTGVGIALETISIAYSMDKFNREIHNKS